LITTPATASTAITAGPLQQALIYDFVAYIDRGEQTTRAYITNLRQFIAWIRYKEILSPQRGDILAYKQYLTSEHDAIILDPLTPAGWKYRTDHSGNRIKICCKATTVKQYLQSVRQFFAWAAACGYYPDIAANIHGPKIRQSIHKKDALTPADVLKIEKSITAEAAAKYAAAAESLKDPQGKKERAAEQGKRLLAMYLLAVNAGLRTIELSRANIRDIGTKDGQAYIYIWGKGHAEADAKKVIAPEVYAAICDYIKSRPDRPAGSSPLFVATGNRSGGKRLAATTISTMLKRAMQQAGYNSDRITAHSLRHTAGTNTQEITGDLFITQKYMRHESPKTTEIYLHIDTEKREAEIAQQLYNKYHGITEAETPAGKLAAIVQTMTTAQRQQLLAAAETITE